MVGLYAFFRVAMDKRTQREEIEEESFDAVKSIYDHNSGVTVIDIQTMDYKQGKYFTVADVGIELRVKADSYDKACEMAKDILLPTGVAFNDCRSMVG